MRFYTAYESDVLRISFAGNMARAVFQEEAPGLNDPAQIAKEERF
jgi:hypothetical protein